MMKYQKVKQWFKLDGKIVRPFNGEKKKCPKNKLPDVSWSHGFTHFIDKNKNITFCGQRWFEENAVEIKNEKYLCN